MYPILVRRPQVRFKEVKGEVALSKGMRDLAKAGGKVPEIKPVMKHRKGRIAGVLSGRRSALSPVESAWPDFSAVKIKGCGDLNHRVNTRRDHAGEPMGGQTLGYARNDVTATGMITEMFMDQAGVENGIYPLGIIKYDGVEFDGEQCAASVFAIRGDTRINELVALLLGEGHARKRFQSSTFQRRAGSLLYDIGRYCGSLVNVLYRNELIWGTRIYRDGDVLSNAHAGNFVLLPNDNGALDVGMADFDAGSLSEVVLRKRRLLGRFFSSFEKVTDRLDDTDYVNAVMKGIADGISAGKIVLPGRQIQYAELMLLMRSFPYNTMLKVAGEGWEVVSPQLWHENFHRGFCDGLHKPSFRPIPFDYEKLFEEVVEALMRGPLYSPLNEFISEYDCRNPSISYMSPKGGGNFYRSIVDGDFDGHKRQIDDMFDVYGGIKHGNYGQKYIL